MANYGLADSPFHVWANSTDYATGASDAGFTVVDGNTLPLAVDTDFDYFITGVHFTPRSVSDTFLWRLCLTDSDKVEKSQQSMNYAVITGAAVAGADEQHFAYDPPVEVSESSNARFLGVAVDFGDTDALASIEVQGFKRKKHYL